VGFEPLHPGTSMPVLARPAMRGLDLASWADAHRDLIDGRLHEHGAIVFRGFDIQGADGFARVVRAVAGEPLPYEERSSPRTCVSGNIYTSTDHPSDQRIFLHNEQSYNLVFPLRIAFFCARPPSAGGDTPIADTRRIFARIPSEIRARFAREGYLYTRTFDHHLGLSWQTAFQSDDRVQVERYCRRHGIELEWRDGDRLRTRQVRRTAGRHPVTSEPVWFNHATFFHVSTLQSTRVREFLDDAGDDDLPNQTRYGSGAPIEPEVLDTLRAAYNAETVAFPWQQGDVLLLDNMLAAHGRAPFEGPRLILTAMAMPCSWDAVPLVDAASP
jgi:alpha-ketoglutarate-dependent taurine dioxygenase